MKIELKLDLIKKAQMNLLKNPQDTMHDISHHARVVDLCNQLIVAENLTGVDKDIVEVSAWWHDVSISKTDNEDTRREVYKTVDYLKPLVSEINFKLIQDAIINHEFGSTPKFSEGQILQDADKLELLSITRVDSAVDGVLSGSLQKDKVLQTMKYFLDNWLPEMLNNYHFEFSREYHKEKIKEFLKYLKNAEGIIKNLS
jgi:hypothetical protein